MERIEKENETEYKDARKKEYIWLPQLGYRMEVVLLVVFSVLLSAAVQHWYNPSSVHDLRQRTSPIGRLYQETELEDEPNGHDVTPNPMFTYNYDLTGGEHQLQDCHGQLFKQSFHDIDYAFFAYNIFRGYPLAIGHDPGFTLPIFLADYSHNLSTADCRYSVPYGLIAVPDVSCVTSFTSSIVQSTNDFHKSLSASAQVSGGGWGVQFSASAGYKESISTMASGEALFVMSQAKCNYYFTQIEKMTPPHLHPNFLKKVKQLETNDVRDSYIDFFNTYGTHFPTKMLFGARFTFQNKMTIKSYKEAKDSSFSVSAQASYSGLMSIGGGFNLDSAQRDAASNFSKSVETTTVAVGAPPPANGDTMTWASTVKDSPVPSQYTLESIEDLFTETYMNNTGIDYNKIRTNIIKYKDEYCRELLSKGEIWSCSEKRVGFNITGNVLIPYEALRLWQDLPLDDCIQLCERTEKCYLVVYSTHNCSLLLLPNKTMSWQYMASNIFNASAITNIIFTSKIVMAQVDLRIPRAIVKPEIKPQSQITMLRTYVNDSYEFCRSQCLWSPYCFVFSYYVANSILICDLHTEMSLSRYDTPFIHAYYTESQSAFISRSTKHDTGSVSMQQIMTEEISEEKETY